MVAPSALVVTQRPEWRDVSRTYVRMEILDQNLGIFLSDPKPKIDYSTNSPVNFQIRSVAIALYLDVHSIRGPEIPNMVVSRPFPR